MLDIFALSPRILGHILARVSYELRLGNEHELSETWDFFRTSGVVLCWLWSIAAHYSAPTVEHWIGSVEQLQGQEADGVNAGHHQSHTLNEDPPLAAQVPRCEAVL